MPPIYITEDEARLLRTDLMALQDVVAAQAAKITEQDAKIAALETVDVNVIERLVALEA